MRRIPFWILPGLPLDQGFQLATGGRLIHGSYWFKFRKTKLSLSLAFLTILPKYRLFLWGWGRHQFICSLEIFLWDNKELKRTPEHQVCGCQGLKRGSRHCGLSLHRPEGPQGGYRRNQEPWKVPWWGWIILRLRAETFYESRAFPHRQQSCSADSFFSLQPCVPFLQKLSGKERKWTWNPKYTLWSHNWMPWTRKWQLWLLRQNDIRCFTMRFGFQKKHKW